VSILDYSDAQTILADATLTAEAVQGCQDRLTAFLRRYVPHFYRIEQRRNAALVIRGLISGVERKTCEPIAIEARLRKPGSGDAIRNLGRVVDARPGMDPPAGRLRAGGRRALIELGPCRASRTKLSYPRLHRHQEAAVVGYWPGVR
jgi:hypothetical protein